ncbi:MAG: MOSC N-terminal beta barrel domain-containing protein [Solirubrobacteraceae bacterium]
MQVGTLVGMWRYPVKSMAAEALTEAEVGWHGIAGDRRWAFVRPHVERSGFPWLTLREVADMGQFTTRFVDPAEPDRSPTLVTTPDGDEHEVTDPALAARLGGGVRVIKQNVGVFDSLPLSLITTTTVDGIQGLVGRPLEVARFRPNLLVAAAPGEAFPEDDWLGASLSIGEMRMRIDCRDPRCVIVTMDPETGRRDPTVLREIARHRANCAGVYGTTVTPGHIALGDAVLIDRHAP